jgi:diguanylate cyclase
MNLMLQRHPRYRAPALVVAFLGAALSATTWFVAAGWEDRIAKAEFDSRANNIGAVLQNNVNGNLSKIIALRALFDASQDKVSKQEFLAFSDGLLRNQSAILSLSWAPRISHSKRAAHEEEVRRADGNDDYQIRSVREDGTLEPSVPDAEYFPVRYTTERFRANVVQGLNLSDGGIREQPLEKARDGDTLAASQNFTLQSGTGDRFGFFVVLPIYKRALPHGSIEQRRDNLLGFVQAVFQIDTMFDAALLGIQSPADVFVFPPTAGPDPRAIYVRPSMPSQAPTKGSSSRAELNAAIHWSKGLDIADRQWSIIAVPAKRAAKHFTAWSLLGAGIGLTVAVFLFMRQSNAQVRRLIESNELVSELARTDSLTGLANRPAFHDRLTAAFEAARSGGESFAVLYIDLDRFKDLNDLKGHPAGDALLVQAGQLLRAETDGADCVARLGGDEFAVLTNAGDAEASERLAEKLIRALRELFVVEGSGVALSASIGISLYAAELEGADVLLVQADSALYRAKNAGRNRVCLYQKEFDRHVRDQITLGRELMLAIRDGNLALQYQPQVEIKSGRIIGLEALVRWNHPERGAISPAVFIPIAESNGSIAALGKWVFDEACRQTRAWRDDGIDVPTVAINVSAIQCKQSTFEQDITTSLNRWKIAPAWIELELTESVLMEATQDHRDVIARLRALGLKLAIDDFGTGYSSLSYLTNFPVDRIKIAQELILKCTTETRYASVARAAIRLAEELDTELLAEGVENAEQALFLSSAGCKFAQGYLFSRPVEPAQAATLLRKRFIGPLSDIAASKDRNAAA